MKDRKVSISMLTAGFGCMLAFIALTIAPPAGAGDVDVLIGLNFGLPGYYAAPPVVAAPPPVIVQQAPVVVEPPPVVIYRQPVVVAPGPGAYYYNHYPPGHAKKHYKHHKHRKHECD